MDYTLSVVAAVLLVYAVALNLRALTWVTPDYRRRKDDGSSAFPLAPMPWDLEPRGRRLGFLAVLLGGVAAAVAGYATGVLGAA